MDNIASSTLRYRTMYHRVKTLVVTRHNINTRKVYEATAMYPAWSSGVMIKNGGRTPAWSIAEVDIWRGGG